MVNQLVIPTTFVGLKTRVLEHVDAELGQFYITGLVILGSFTCIVGRFTNAGEAYTLIGIALGHYLGRRGRR